MVQQTALGKTAMNKPLVPRLATMAASIGLGLALAAADGQPAEAGSPCLTYSVMTCAPWQESLQADTYFQVAGRIKHKGNATGSIQAFCPVFNNTGEYSAAWNDLTLLYHDPDGPQANAQVTATLRYVDNFGRVATVASVNSNGSSATPDLREATTIFRHEFDLINRYYYIQVSVRRTVPTLSPEAGGVKLCERIL
jgi:hypothetical protein